MHPRHLSPESDEAPKVTLGRAVAGRRQWMGVTGTPVAAGVGDACSGGSWCGRRTFWWHLLRVARQGTRVM
jgi:hypothetical protein